MDKGEPRNSRDVELRDDDLMTVAEVAAMLRKSVKALYNWRADPEDRSGFGRVPSYRPGGGRPLYRRSDVQNFIDSHREE